jgi:hypothetical protein
MPLFVIGSALLLCLKGGAEDAAEDVTEDVSDAVLAYLHSHAAKKNESSEEQLRAFWSAEEDLDPNDMIPDPHVFDPYNDVVNLDDIQEDGDTRLREVLDGLSSHFEVLSPTLDHLLELRAERVTNGTWTASVSHVPRIVHWIRLGHAPLRPSEYFSLSSILRHVKPDVLMVHAPANITDDPLYRLAGSPGWVAPTDLVQQDDYNPEVAFSASMIAIANAHVNSVHRLLPLLIFGGVCVDSDVLAVQSWDAIFDHDEAFHPPLSSGLTLGRVPGRWHNLLVGSHVMFARFASQYLLDAVALLNAQLTEMYRTGNIDARHFRNLTGAVTELLMKSRESTMTGISIRAGGAFYGLENLSGPEVIKTLLMKMKDGSIGVHVLRCMTGVRRMAGVRRLTGVRSNLLNEVHCSAEDAGKCWMLTGEAFAVKLRGIWRPEAENERVERELRGCLPKSRPLEKAVARVAEAKSAFERRVTTVLWRPSLEDGVNTTDDLCFKQATFTLCQTYWEMPARVTMCFDRAIRRATRVMRERAAGLDLGSAAGQGSGRRVARAHGGLDGSDLGRIPR